MKHKKRSRIGQGFAIILIMGGVTIAWMSTSRTQADRPVVSVAAASASMTDRMAAPNFALPDLKGKTVNLSDFDGTMVLVDVPENKMISYVS